MQGWPKRTDFGRCVKDLLKYRGWTVQELALLVGCSAGYLYRVLRGEQEPTWSLACAIADQLEFFVDMLRDDSFARVCPHCKKPPIA